MLKHQTHRRLLTVALVLIVTVTLVISAPKLAAAKIQIVNGRACWNAVYVSLEMDNQKDPAPAVGYRYKNQTASLHVISSRPQPSGKDTHIVYEYYVDVAKALPTGAVGQILIDGSAAGSFSVSGDCPVLGRVAGVAYLDANANGKRDPGEALFPAAWLKVTGGGVWFVCGSVGGDATFGVTVNPGTYYVMPVAPQGYRTTTPRITTFIADRGFIGGADMGFVKDPKAPGDACDQYNPPRP